MYDLCSVKLRRAFAAEVNKVKGGGYEDVKTYNEYRDMKVEPIFFDIENIHRYSF